MTLIPAPTPNIMGAASPPDTTRAVIPPAIVSEPPSIQIKFGNTDVTKLSFEYKITNYRCRRSPN
jgi:hypothetical protein